MDQLLAQIFVAALADPDKPGSSACRDLTRHQTQPGGNVWPAPPASDFSDGLVSLRQRIRPQSKLSTKMEIRALWFS